MIKETEDEDQQPEIRAEMSRLRSDLIDDHRSRPLGDITIDEDIVICMDERKRRHVMTLRPDLDVRNWDVEDPIGGDIDTYRACSARLKSLVDELATELGSGD